MKKNLVIFGIRNKNSIAHAIAEKMATDDFVIHMSFEESSSEYIEFLKQEQNWNIGICSAVDVREEDQVQQFLTDIHTNYGEIDCILHSVAFANQNVLCISLDKNEEPPSYFDIPFADWMDAMNISAYSLLRITRCALPFLKEGSSIVTLTYNASQRVFPGYAGMAMVKAALENIMKYLAFWLGEKGIRINALSPGLIMTTSSAALSGVRTLRKITKAAAPLGNVQNKDVANAAYYYFTDLSNGITGNIHYIDGGYNIMGVNEA